MGSGSPSPGVVKGRPEWLRRQGDGFGRRGSPLGQSPGRPGTGRSDEGLGTSPASEVEGSGMSLWKGDDVMMIDDCDVAMIPQWRKHETLRNQGASESEEQQCSRIDLAVKIWLS